MARDKIKIYELAQEDIRDWLVDRLKEYLQVCIDEKAYKPFTEWCVVNNFSSRSIKAKVKARITEMPDPELEDLWSQVNDIQQARLEQSTTINPIKSIFLLKSITGLNEESNQTSEDGTKPEHIEIHVHRS